MFLWFVALLAAVIVFIVIALLVHPPSAHGKFALASFRMSYRMSGWRVLILAGVRHVRLLLQYPELLFVRLGALHWVPPQLPPLSAGLWVWASPARHRRALGVR